MNTDNFDSASRLLACIGEINDTFLEEAELADITYNAIARKRIVKYSAFAVAASFGLAMTYWLFRSKRGATTTTTRIISKKSA